MALCSYVFARNGQVAGFPDPNPDRPAQRGQGSHGVQFDPRTAAPESWIYVLVAARRELENSYPDHAEVTDQQLIQICCRLRLRLARDKHGELMRLSR